MNRPPEDRLAVVLALTDPATLSLETSLGRFADEVGSRGEVILVDASGDGSGEEMARRFARVRLIRRPHGWLAPWLWRDGLLATDAALVGFSTAQMIPCSGWLASLTDRLHSTGAAGVGGPIEPGATLLPTDRAVALLRYSRYFPPLPVSDRVDPPGDNALYRRDRLTKVASSWTDGFWENDVHQALRDRGESLAMSDQAVVSFEGGISLMSMVGQRFAHARRYGAGRSTDLGLMKRLVRGAAGPLVPPLLCGRIASAMRSRRLPLFPWLPAVPSLAVLATAWAMGEAVGTVRGSGPSRSGGRFPLDPDLVVNPLSGKVRS